MTDIQLRTFKEVDLVGGTVMARREMGRHYADLILLPGP